MDAITVGLTAATILLKLLDDRIPDGEMTQEQRDAKTELRKAASARLQDVAAAALQKGEGADTADETPADGE